MNDATCDRKNDMYTPVCQQNDQMCGVLAHFHVVKRKSRQMQPPLKLISGIQFQVLPRWPNRLLTDVTSDGQNLKAIRQAPL